jgi:hypothetical protein
VVIWQACRARACHGLKGGNPDGAGDAAVSCGAGAFQCLSNRDPSKVRIQEGPRGWGPGRVGMQLCYVTGVWQGPRD